MNRPALVLLTFTIAACQSPKSGSETTDPPMKGSFGYDETFLKKYKDVIVLGGQSGDDRVLVVKDYQARVMTSTSNGSSGNSYGWINYDLIASGKSLPHINPLGGEDRFWLGPEGGQFALYFKQGDPFEFEKWQTPPAIDTETFDLVSADTLQATFAKSTEITNYAGTPFRMDIRRQIRLLPEVEINEMLGTPVDGIRAVGFQTINTITNAGSNPWKEETGLVSIWILGMFNPSPATTVIIPFLPSAERNKLLTDDYFGSIPENRLMKTDSFLLFKGDGVYRGKIGIAPKIAREVAGSYDAEKQVLTLVKFDIHPDARYVNSKWEMQKDPYGGDAVNSYNDGPLADGGQLGPFYEIESSSPALALQPGASATHRHTTIHLEGDEAVLDRIAMKVLGVSIRSLASAFPAH